MCKCTCSALMRMSLCYSVAQSCPTLRDPWTAAHQASLSSTISRSLLRLTSIESVMSPNHLILCCPLLLLPSIFPSIRVLSNESALCIRQPKYWSFSFSISPSNEYSGLISFRRMSLELCKSRDFCLFSSYSLGLSGSLGPQAGNPQITAALPFT